NRTPSSRTSPRRTRSMRCCSSTQQPWRARTPAGSANPGAITRTCAMLRPLYPSSRAELSSGTFRTFAIEFSFSYAQASATRGGVERGQGSPPERGLLRENGHERRRLLQALPALHATALLVDSTELFSALRSPVDDLTASESNNSLELKQFATCADV